MRIRRRGKRWTIEDRVRIDAMTLPRSAELPASGGRPLAGFWYEVRDGKGEALFRRVTRNPAEPALEVPAPDGGLQRVTLERPDVVFDVLIPDLDEADELCFFESDPRAAGTASGVGRSLEPVAAISLRRRRRSRAQGG
jgi:hypothetical protein